ncbi:LacI family DNA-binding transcriptional regulator [Jeotgalibacillus proteolyticus]|uniref:LacI family transcriptional regulator n=1 Tax=Jeotgalibacillus proteolyticus TaxID=2082395 RepID=A0A2S5GCJ6_9BACL|nr:LacI family DNA-binding transcriptional regulator [Jeotgalibacillus proteolyticus]PPA70623.1 LacI family transcriptional regulator [Jeotgalibacillus proteolyticus]
MATIKDIAKKAGVSITTVSRALNGYSDVNEDTRKKIVETAKILNYSPNSIARSLVMKKSKTIGLLVSGFIRENAKDNFMIEVMTGINDFASQTDYDIVLFTTNSSKQREKTYTQLCRERQVDGVIIQGIRTDDPYLEEVVEGEIPCVLVDIPRIGKHAGYVSTDNIAGAYEAGKYLTEAGHKEIAMINGHDYAFVSKERLEGFTRALLEEGIELPAQSIENGEFSEEGGEEAALRLLEKNSDLTAIFCSSDLMAIGAMNAIKSKGLRVPEDISIIGYDNILLSRYVQPSLTTIAQDTNALGYEAAKMLIAMLDQQKPPGNTIVKHELIVRNSSKKR